MPKFVRGISYRHASHPLNFGVIDNLTKAQTIIMYIVIDKIDVANSGKYLHSPQQLTHTLHASHSISNRLGIVSVSAARVLLFEAIIKLINVNTHNESKLPLSM